MDDTIFNNFLNADFIDCDYIINTACAAVEFTKGVSNRSGQTTINKKPVKNLACFSDLNNPSLLLANDKQELTISLIDAAIIFYSRRLGSNTASQFKEIHK